MADLGWLIARPIAHRGLHDAAGGVIENTASAFNAAIVAGYAIETDLQISADGEAMVHHDDAFGRLTEGDGRLADMSAVDIKRVAFKATADRIMTLSELCALVAGRVPLLLELKSRFDGDMRLVPRLKETLARYGGHAAAMSFDPAVVAAVHQQAPAVTRGIVAERHYEHGEWDRMGFAAKGRMAFLLHAGQTQPHFIAYAVNDLPALAPWVARTLFRRPLLTWTVRSPAQKLRATRWADQMIFEGWRP